MKLVGKVVERSCVMLRESQFKRLIRGLYGTEEAHVEVGEFGKVNVYLDRNLPSKSIVALKGALSVFLGVKVFDIHGTEDNKIWIVYK